MSWNDRAGNISYLKTLKSDFLKYQYITVIFICHLAWAYDDQIFGKTLFPSVSVRVFLEEISIWISWLNTVDGPPQIGWASPSPLEAWTEWKGWRENSLSLSLSLSRSLPDCWTQISVSSCRRRAGDLHHKAPGSYALSLRLQTASQNFPGF